MIFGMFTPLALAIVVIGMVLSGGAALLVRVQFSRGQKVQMANGMTGREVAERVLRDANIRDVQIVEYPGFLSDHYSPMTKTLALSPDVYNGTTAAAAGVAAHEVGHAIQHARNYGPMWLRSILVPPANLGSSIAPWLISIGFVFSARAGHPAWAHTLAIAGVVLFAAATAFTLVTVPVEFNASARARERLSALGITQPGEEDHIVRGVLFAAGLTYVAAAVTSIMWLLYYHMQLGLLGNQSSNDR